MVWSVGWISYVLKFDAEVENKANEKNYKETI